MKDLIAKLVAGESLTGEEALNGMRTIMAGDATPAQIAAYITALRLRGETPEIISGSAQAMRENFSAVKAPEGIVVDTCGTGGDGHHTFNISTTAAFVTAGAGVVVAKHGNKSVSSKCGSADVLDALGVNIAITPEHMEKCLEQVGIAFLFAPALHPAMKHAIGPRREIGIRTIFNILGPLSNPAGAQYGVLGVYSSELVPVLALAAAELGSQHLFVVHGEDGLDEISTTGITHVAEVVRGKVKHYELSPDQVGLETATLESLKGGEPSENAAITRAVLDGEAGPRRDIVLLNAAAAIVAGGKAADLKEGVVQAAASIDSGAAKGKLNDLAACASSTA